MSSRDYNFRIKDIINSINRIELYIDKMTFNEFKNKELTIDAVVRNFEIIGEASKYVPEAIRKNNPDIPWKEMHGMRNILIHEYFGVDIKTLWHTAKKSFTRIKKEIGKH